MQQRFELATQKSIVDEEVFLERELRVRALEVTCAVVADAVSKGEVLSARRCADRVRLNKAEFSDGANERGGFVE
jgi:hypothetical protein